MYIDEKINNSKSSKILVVGQPMSGMTFSACKYAIEQAYLGKTVYIFRDTKQQLTAQGGTNDVLEHIQDSYRILRGDYSGKVLTRAVEVTEGRGCYGDVMIYDRCRLYNGVMTFGKYGSVEKEIIMSYYKDLNKEYDSYLVQGYDIIEARMEENINGIKRNPSYKKMIDVLPALEYIELMSLPSDRFGNDRFGNKTIKSKNGSSYTLTSNKQPFTVLHEGNKIECNIDGSIVINGRFIVNADDSVVINGKVTIGYDGSVSVNGCV